ncbi:DUF4913 domain-containing protein [Nocardia sp. GCM10030253]|uniref:DUF4913 domain-containing protein n=1 Tax=Nocardia sp. GCM10030253 TaxID=3273404 RepID=UPI0036317632
MSDEQTPSVYRSVPEFVENYLSLIYRRDIDIHAWCPEWWQHAEAVARLDALWRTWEYYRLNAHTGLSVWLLDHADAQMSVLLSPDGPFSGCSVRNGHSAKIPPLPLKAPFPQLFRSPTLSRDD